MDEELIREIDQLSVDQPRIDLMEEYFVADEENAGEHVFDHGVSTDASLMDSVQELTTSQTLLQNVCIELNQGREELGVEAKAELKRGYGQGTVLEVFTLDREKMLLVHLQNLTDTRAEGFHVDSMECLFIFVSIVPNPVIKTGIHVTVHVILLCASLPIFFVSQLEGHFRADTAKLGQEGLNHLKAGAQMHNLVDLFDLCARQEIEVGVDHEADDLVGTVTTIATSIHALIKHHLLDKF